MYDQEKLKSRDEMTCDSKLKANQTKIVFFDKLESLVSVDWMIKNQVKGFKNVLEDSFCIVIKHSKQNDWKISGI